MHAESEDIAEHWVVDVLEKARTVRGIVNVKILKDELARAVFLESRKVDKVTRLIGWREGSEAESVVWLAAGVYHYRTVS